MEEVTGQNAEIANPNEFIEKKQGNSPKSDSSADQESTVESKMNDEFPCKLGSGVDSSETSEVINNNKTGLMSRKRPRQKKVGRQKGGRGIPKTPQEIIKQFVNLWENIREWIDANESEKEEIVEHFNGLIDEEPELGTELFEYESDDSDGVEAFLGLLDDGTDNLQKVADAIIEQEIIEIE